MGGKWKFLRSGNGSRNVYNKTVERRLFKKYDFDDAKGGESKTLHFDEGKNFRNKNLILLCVLAFVLAGPLTNFSHFLSVFRRSNAHSDVINLKRQQPEYECNRERRPHDRWRYPKQILIAFAFGSDYRCGIREFRRCSIMGKNNSKLKKRNRAQSTYELMYEVPSIVCGAQLRRYIINQFDGSRWHQRTKCEN